VPFDLILVSYLSEEHQQYQCGMFAPLTVLERVLVEVVQDCIQSSIWKFQLMRTMVNERTVYCLEMSSTEHLLT
jgi:hypothetical protein